MAKKKRDVAALLEQCININGNRKWPWFWAMSPEDRAELSEVRSGFLEHRERYSLRAFHKVCMDTFGFKCGRPSFESWVKDYGEEESG